MSLTVDVPDAMFSCKCIPVSCKDCATAPFCSEQNELLTLYLPVGTAQLPYNCFRRTSCHRKSSALALCSNACCFTISKSSTLHSAKALTSQKQCISRSELCTLRAVVRACRMATLPSGGQERHTGSCPAFQACIICQLIIQQHQLQLR